MQKANIHKDADLHLWHEYVRKKACWLQMLLQDKALQFKKQIGVEDSCDFPVSYDGWTTGKCFNVWQLTVSNEALSVGEGVGPDFKNYLFNLTDAEGISGKQLYHGDETGLNNKMLLQKILVPKQEAGWIQK